MIVTFNLVINGSCLFNSNTRVGKQTGKYVVKMCCQKIYLCLQFITFLDAFAWVWVHAHATVFAMQKYC